MNQDFGPLPTVATQPEQKNGVKPKREVLDKPRARKAAAQALALAMQGRYRRLLEATGEDEIVVATADLAQVMYENVEFTIWALKTVAGMNPPPPEVLKPISKSHVPPPANDDPRFAKPPVLEIEEPVKMTCTCPPMDKELIGANRHMTSCPLYQP